MSPAELALHRSGGACACGCQGGGVEATFVFSPGRWPELATHPDNCVALSSVHRGGRIPRRAARHAELLATIASYPHLTAGGQIVGIEWCFGMVTHRWYLNRRWERELNGEWEVTLKVIR